MSVPIIGKVFISRYVLSLQHQVKRSPSGPTGNKASATLQDAELIRYFKEIENMLAEDKDALLRIIVAFIGDTKTKQAYSK